MPNTYQLTIQETLKALETSENGLTSQEAVLRLEKYGENTLKEANKNPRRKIFLSQFKSALVIILIIATLISAFIGETVDAIIIFVIVILNAVFGFVQEYKADKAIQSLKKLASLKSKVFREGKEQLIDACKLTIGDIIFLDTGDKIPADARLLEAINLEIQEAILTGESISVEKITDPIENIGTLQDQKNMIFSGTIITKGRGKAVVTAIGMQTEIGKIATLLQETQEKETNLEKKLNGLSKWLGVLTIFVCIIIFLTYFFVRHLGLEDAFLTAVALAVAAIPEGLPAVVTISLGLGVKRFVKKNVLVRKLSSVETLGSVNIICTDKTGTLTKNEMTVTKLFVNNKIIEVSGTGYGTDGKFSEDPKTFSKLLEIGLFCNNSKLEEGNIIGDPTEGALIVSAIKGGIEQNQFLIEHKRIGEIPFDSERKMMTVIYEKNNPGNHSNLCKSVVLTKGAIENLLPKCEKILINGEEILLTQEKKSEILSQAESFSQQALRVLGFAYKSSLTREVPTKEAEGLFTQQSESNLIFVGLQAMIDPARPEAKQAINECKTAGIRVIMITGDNLITAKAIGNELGIEGQAITGEEFINSENKIELINQIGIFARVNPEHKLEIVKLLQDKGNVVAMTGDGVNDAPALKMADIGVGMGITGTDVSKEASDMILTDDNFASIVNAVREGRGIYDNIQKFVSYLLASNIGEIIILFITSLIGVPLPLLAIHLLRINLVTDGLPAIALGVDPINPNVMNRPPRKGGESIIGKKMIINIVFLSGVMAIGTLFFFLKNHNIDLEMSRTGVFLLIVFMELIKIQVIRSQYGLGIFSNKRLIVAVTISIGLVLGIVYSPLNILFDLKPLSVSMRRDIAMILTGLLTFGIVFNLIIKKKKIGFKI